VPLVGHEVTLPTPTATTVGFGRHGGGAANGRKRDGGPCALSVKPL